MMMMKLFSPLLLVMLLCHLFACNEESKPTSVETSPVAFTPLLRSYVKTDTVRFTHDSSRMAVIGLLTPGNIYLEDSSRKVAVDVLYYIKGKQVSAHTDTFNTHDEEELSYYFEGMDTSGNGCERFFTVNFGYPACGYTQWHLTFFANNTACYFVCRHTSSADGAWGSGLEFFDACGAKADTEIRSAMVSRGSEVDTGDIITVSYSDSTLYRFDGQVWKAESLTPKDKVYRSSKDSLY